MTSVDEKYSLMMAKADTVDRDDRSLKDLREALYIFNERGDAYVTPTDAIAIYRIVKLVLEGKFTEEMKL